MLHRSCVLALAIAGAIASAGQTVAPAGRSANIDAFETVWTTVRDKHWDPQLGGLNWQAVHDELRPAVENAASMDEARAAMTKMLERLRQTHFGIVPSEVYGEMKPAGKESESGSVEGNPGIELRVIDGHALVTALEPASPAAAAGVQPGWEIVKVTTVKEICVGHIPKKMEYS